MVPINLTTVIARPGARGDFVAGWLGTLPNFIDSQWRIDLPTGRSLGLMNCLKEIDTVDYGKDTLDRLLKFRNFSLGPSNWNFAMSCHGNKFEEKIVLTPQVQLVQILTDSADRALLNWEFIAKTYFSQERFESSVQENKIYNVDKVDTKSPVEFIKQQARFIQQLPDYRLQLDCIQVQYQDLFVPGGSWHLCNKLGINVLPEYHRYWDIQLGLANSKLSYTAFGHNWTIDNYCT